MQSRRLAPEQLRHDIFLGSAAIRDGVITPAQLRSRVFQRVLHDVYAVASVPIDHGVRIAAAHSVMPELSAIAGRSAAWLYGAQLLGRHDPVEVFSEPEVRRHPRGGIEVHTGALPADDVVQIGRYRVTTPARSCVDVARWHHEDIAIALVDAMLRLHIVSSEDLERQLAGATGRGVIRAGQLLVLADGRAESPQESVLRLRVIRAGLTPPEPQVEVRHQGRFVARVDLGWRQSKVALEYDGAWHGAPGQLAADRRRLNALIAAGWTVIHVTAPDLHDFSGTLIQIRAALAAAA